jgi:4-aminobutyrate aminotransferase-like enzyme
MLNAMAEYRGGKLWFPYIGSGIGRGALVELADGSVKYDFISGIGVHFFGHNHPALIDAAVDAAISNTIMQGNLQQNIDSLNLSALLTQASGLPHCFLTNSGAMANENALKIAFQKHYPAYRVLAFDHCFAGRTLTLSQITDKPAYREGLPHNAFVDYVPFFDPENPEKSTEHAVDVVKKYIARYPKEHALMCFEFVQGERGFYTGSEAFFKAIIKVLKEHQIAVFADEVQSFGRTQQLFAYQHFNLQPHIDIASIGKLSQVCATLFTDAYKPKMGLLSQTFTGSTSAIKAFLVVLNGLMKGGYYGPEGKIQQLHLHFVKQLERLSQKHPSLIQGPFGIGCMIAFTPYDGSSQKTINYVHRLFDAGVLSFIAGSNPTRVRFLIPAGAVTFEDIDQAVKIIEQTLLQSK